jgi:hypothetical protein
MFRAKYQSKSFKIHMGTLFQKKRKVHVIGFFLFKRLEK